jgi:hypothetical protein
MTAPALQAGKLIRLLGSNRDGEVLAAARALDQTLRSAGFDWHDLADVAERCLLLRSATTSIARSSSSARPPWQELAEECLRHGGYSLKRSEIDFLSSMSGWPTSPSDRQLAWLDAIVRSLNLGRAAA